MTVYIDDAYNPFGRLVMCHMIADTTEELHEMARKLGLKREWFQAPPKHFPHYDVSLTKRSQAAQFGAKLVTERELVMKIRELRKAQNDKNTDS